MVFDNQGKPMVFSLDVYLRTNHKHFHIDRKRYIIGTCKKEKNIENIVLEKLRFSGALFFF